MMNLSIFAHRPSKQSVRNALIALACVCVIANAGVFAYLTSSDKITNLFRIAEGIEIEVVEPNWDPNDASGMLPGQSIIKDPAIHNKSRIDVYIFADVNIPRKEIVTADSDGSVNERALVDLFTYKSKDGWLLKETIFNEDSVTYRYIHEEVVPASTTTTPIFDEVTLVNYIDEQFNTGEIAQQIVINGYAIQAKGFEDSKQAYEAFFAPEQHSFIADVVLNDPDLQQGSLYQICLATEPEGPETCADRDYSITFPQRELTEGSEYQIIDSVTHTVLATFIAHEEDVQDGRIVITNYAQRYDRAHEKGEIDGIVFWLDDETNTTYIAPKNGVFGHADNMPESFNTSAFGNTTGGMVKQGKHAVVLPGVDLGNLDYLFAYSPTLETVDIRNLSVGSVDSGGPVHDTTPNVERMFAGCTSLSTIEGIETLDISRAQNLKMMFADCKSLTSLDLSRWNTEQATDLNGMFNNCSKLQQVDVSGWKTDNVTDMSNLFGYDSQLLTPSGIESWNTSHVKSFARAFINCYAIESLDLSRWSTSSAKDLSNMISKCTALKELRFTVETTAQDATMQNMIAQCSALDSIEGLADWDTSNVVNMYGLFWGCPALHADCSGFDITHVTDHTAFASGSPYVIAPSW